MEKGTAWSRLSPAAKETHYKYDQKNYSVVGTKLPRERADAFRAWCASQGRSVSGVLSEYIYSIIGREPDAAQAATQCKGARDAADKSDD